MVKPFTKSAISSSLRSDRFIFKMLQVDPAAYQLLLDCIESNDINVCDQVPLGVESGGRKLINPLGGGGHQVDGADRCACPSALMHVGLSTRTFNSLRVASVRRPHHIFPPDAHGTASIIPLSTFTMLPLMTFCGRLLVRSILALGPDFVRRIIQRRQHLHQNARQPPFGK